MFEPKSLKQAYILARLHDNTLTHRLYSSNPNKQTYHPTTYAYQNKTSTPLSYNKSLPGPPNNSYKVLHASILPTLPPYNPNNVKSTTRPFRNSDLDERRAKGFVFWCDEKFIPKHRCQNKKLYSLCVVKEDGEGSEENGVTKLDHDTYNPHISLNALKGMIGLNTLRVIDRVEKQPFFILVDFGSTHNFISNQMTDMLRCKTTSIKALTVQVVDGGTMTCTSVCNNFQWSIHRVNFTTDVFTLDLKNCDMILGIQWLAKLKTIICNYEEIWMALCGKAKKSLSKGMNQCQ